MVKFSGIYLSARLASYYIYAGVLSLPTFLLNLYSEGIVFLFFINDDSICSVLVSSIIAVAAVFLISFFNFLFGQCKGKKFQDPLDLALLFVGGEVISFKRLLDSLCCNFPILHLLS